MREADQTREHAARRRAADEERASIFTASKGRCARRLRVEWPARNRPSPGRSPPAAGVAAAAAAPASSIAQVSVASSLTSAGTTPWSSARRFRRRAGSPDRRSGGPETLTLTKSGGSEGAMRRQRGVLQRRFQHKRDAVDEAAVTRRRGERFGVEQSRAADGSNGRRLKPGRRRPARAEDRLVVDDDLAARDRAGEVVFEARALAPRARAGAKIASAGAPAAAPRRARFRRRRGGRRVALAMHRRHQAAAHAERRRAAFSSIGTASVSIANLAVSAAASASAASQASLNTSPPSRAASTASGAAARTGRRDGRAIRRPPRGRAFVDGAEAGDVEQQAARGAAGPAKAKRWPSASANQARLARPVTASCRARRAAAPRRPSGR